MSGIYLQKNNLVNFTYSNYYLKEIQCEAEMSFHPSIHFNPTAVWDLMDAPSYTHTRIYSIIVNLHLTITTLNLKCISHSVT